MDDITALLIVLTIVFGYIFFFIMWPVSLAGKKGSSRFLWFILAVLFGPIALMMALAMPYKPTK